MAVSVVFQIALLLVVLGVYRIGAESALDPAEKTSPPEAEMSSPSTTAEAEAIDEERVFTLRRCSGAGCPYTASWLAHINLYKNLNWKTDSTKMESHSFVIFDSARQKYQLDDHNAYYVHHMSMYEHALHKQQGFEIAQNLTTILAQASYEGECSKLSPSAFSRRGYVGLVPFYSGLPPNVTAGLHVKSIGQGNSLVKEEVKLDWLMATTCSMLKYFGEVCAHAYLHPLAPSAHVTPYGRNLSHTPNDDPFFVPLSINYSLTYYIHR